MMAVMFDRSIFAAVAIAFAMIGPAPIAHADPPKCPASGCPHGTAAAPAPPSANVNSPSYKDGYKVEHDYFAIPQNHAYLASEMKSGYTVMLACQVEVKGGPEPANLNDWLAGCADALHDLGFKP